MKIILFFIGSLGALYAIASAALFVRDLLAGKPGSADIADIAASLVPVCIGLIICVACFQHVFRKPK